MYALVSSLKMEMEAYLNIILGHAKSPNQNPYEFQFEKCLLLD